MNEYGLQIYPAELRLNKADILLIQRQDFRCIFFFFFFFFFGQLLCSISLSNVFFSFNNYVVDIYLVRFG